MTKQELLKQQEKMIRESWFNKHVVLGHNLDAYARGRNPIETLVWGKPDTIHMKVWYVLQHSTLMVYGDLGEATYRWYGLDIDFEWISGCDLSYFHGKCMASEKGSSIHNYEWSEQLAKADIFENYKNDRDCKGYKKYLDSNFSNMIHSKEEFHAALITEDAYDVFGDDWYEWVPGVGQITPLRCQAHLIGLKMAFGR